MKTYLPLILLIWLAACSSPAAQNASTQNSTQKPDTAAEQNETQDTTAKPPTTNATTANTNNAQLFLNEEGITVPPYGLDKIKALVAKVEFREDDGIGGSEALNEATYNSLSVKEKFTYSMVHPENYTQICDPWPAHKDKATRIYGKLDGTYGEYTWSDRQENFFKANRVEVAQMMKELIAKENKIETNFKEVIILMNGTELIPYLIDFYNKEKKDHYILTVLLQLMKDNNYPEFVNSSGYKKLYREPQSEEEYMNPPYLVSNKANQDLIIQRATNFYNGLQAK